MWIWKRFKLTKLFTVCYKSGNQRSIKEASGVLLSDLSKAFDCLSCELIIAKLCGFGFSLSVLKLMQSCLSER